MKRFLNLLILVLIACPVARAEPEVRIEIDGAGFFDPETGEPLYFPEDLPQVEVYRGTKSVPGEFLPMGWIGNCTATAVAPNVVVTAGHCKSTGARITFKHRESGKDYAALCTRHPRYNTRTVYNDYTFCKLSESLPAGSVLASFDIETRPAAGTKLLMNGFGAPNVGTHHWGTTSVTRYDGQDLVTCGPSNLGGGDSGGSMLLWSEDRSGKSGFTIVGINSRGNNRCDWYNTVAHPEFISFAKDYERAQGVELCGVSADCFNSTPVPPLPSECKPAYDKVALCFWGQPTRHAILEPETCRNSILLLGQCEIEAEKTGAIAL